MLEAPVFRVINCKRNGACVNYHCYMHTLAFSKTCMIAKDTRIRNMKYVQYIGHNQYLHDSARRVNFRRLVHNATDHYHRLMHRSSGIGLMSVNAGLVLFDILPLGLYFWLVLLSVLY